MSAFCPNAATECQVPTSPLVGYNAEAPFTPFFIGKGYGPNFPPPLGWTFDNAGCFVTYHSTFSKLDAEANAYVESVQCVEAQWYSPTGQEANVAQFEVAQPEFLDVGAGAISEFPVI